MWVSCKRYDESASPRLRGEVGALLRAGRAIHESERVNRALPPTLHASGEREKKRQAG
jgi:hypothetical protein